MRNLADADQWWFPVHDLRHCALAALLIRDPDAKCAAVARIAAAPHAIECETKLVAPDGVPGRPDRPRLVPPADVAQRGVGSPRGHAALIHALAHIEFNAINLALDAVWRFDGLPPGFYRDWMNVAAEEARHFCLLCGRLAALDAAYGDFDAHDGLWEMAHKTRDNALARMALVPRVMEARGLDASPLIRDKLQRAGHHTSAAVIDLILNDEIGHVAIGNRWFRFLCGRYGLSPVEVEIQARRRCDAPVPRPPFNLEARRAAGFSADELEALHVGQPAADR
jgi:uncharacterized ferritin-like protein (DUF455 family)